MSLQIFFVAAGTIGCSRQMRPYWSSGINGSLPSDPSRSANVNHQQWARNRRNGAAPPCSAISLQLDRAISRVRHDGERLRIFGLPGMSFNDSPSQSLPVRIGLPERSGADDENVQMWILRRFHSLLLNSNRRFEITNIHYPTDSSSLGDGVRVLTRLIKKIAEIGWNHVA
jgi:hypothetical protein